VPPAVLKRPILLELDQLPFAIFQTLSRERISLGEMGGSHISAIRETDIVSHCTDVLGISDPDDLDEICTLVAEMDEEYLNGVLKRRNASSSSSAGSGNG